MEPEKMAIVAVTITMVTVGLLIGATFLTFDTGDNGGEHTPLTRYTTDRDLAELDLSPDGWSFEMSDGSTLQLSDLLGQVVVVDLMATWCSTCNIQNGYLEEISVNLAGTAVVVSLTVDSSETVSMMADYKSNKGLDWDHGVDTGRSFKDFFNVVNVPTIVLIDADGVFRYLHIGLWSTTSLTDTIATIL
ncbi:MAG: TlpA family protein disulfide reductase [Candidatus Thorarchaeota archaeon]|jgi:thiol-disulfide isomerase/thioredoxin